MRLFIRYGAALFLVAVATGMTAAIPHFAHKTPFLLFFGAVSLAAWFGGLWPGLCATALSVLIVNYLFIPPHYHFSLTASDVFTAAVFSGIATLISYLTTAQHRSSQARVESDQRLEVAMLAAGMGDWQWNIATNTLVVSPRLKEVLGVPDAALETLDAYAQCIHPEDRESVQKDITRAITEKNDYDIEYRVVLPDSSTRWIAARGRAFYDNQGNATRMAGVAMDVTTRRHMEAERRALEERFRLMADSAPVKIWICDTNNLGTWYNKRWLQFTGRTMEQELGAGWAQGVQPDDLSRAVEICNSAFESRQPFTMEFRLRRHDGEYRWVVDTGLPLYGSDSEFMGYIGSVIDITERKLAEENRQQLLVAEQSARAEAERISRMKDEFIATLSHELRTPLNAMIGWSHLIRHKNLSDEELQHGLEVIERNARMQSQLIEDLLDMSRIVSSKLHLDIQPIDLVAVIDAALETARPAAEAKNIELEKNLSTHIGVLQGDPNRLQQVVWNLLSNSVKFTPSGGHVQISLERTPTHIEMTVSDTGQGIAPDFLPHVFEMFRQEDASNTRRHGGLGLGLGIVKQLVELHGGTVTAQSAGENQGATFRVSLPVSSPPKVKNGDSGELQVQDKYSNTVEHSLKGLKILVVDDEADARNLAHHLLREYQAEVVTADSAERALQYLQHKEFDVLISDIAMPDVDGYEFISKVRQLSNGKETIPAIALTAFAQTEARERALATGFQIHLAKPTEPSLLVAAIHELLRSTT